MCNLHEFNNLLQMNKYSSIYKRIVRLIPKYKDMIRIYDSDINYYKSMPIEKAFDIITSKCSSVVYMQANRNTINPGYTNHFGGFQNASGGSSLSDPFAYDPRYCVYG